MTRLSTAQICTFAIAITAFLSMAAPANASEVILPDTDVRFMTAKSNDVEYKLYISVPADYGAVVTRYPVLYLLDADYSFPVARAIVQHLSDRKRLRQLIIVGIAYGGPNQYRLNRTRDYTPKFAPTGGYGPEYQKVSGGAPKFLAFIRDELMPRIDRDFRTIPGEAGLVGHSYGGLFASWVLLTAPETFSHYVIVSPSLWYLDRFMFGLEEQTRNAKVTSQVYMAVGAREGNAQHDMVHDLERMASALSRRPGLKVRQEVFDDEHHDSVFPTALSRGIRFVFGGD